jgi:hypothetical protein
VIDTGGWLTTKKFVVPASQLNESAKHDHAYVVELTKKQIEKCPSCDEADVSLEESWSVYEDRYRTRGPMEPSCTAKASNGTVTRASAEVKAGNLPTSNLSEEDQRADLEGAGPADDRVFPATGNTVSPNPNGHAVGSRYLAFEGEWQSRRKEITSSCATCSKSPESESYHTDRRRTGT